MKKLSLLFTLFIGLAATGQATNDSVRIEEPWTLQNAEKIMKFSPLDAFSAIPTFGADLEVKTKNSTSIQFGAAVIPSFFQYLANDNFSDFDRMGGYRLRSEGRIYMPVKTERYFAFGFSFRHLFLSGTVPFGMEGVDGEWGQREYAYFVNAPMRFHRFNFNTDFKFGVQKKTKNNLVFDFYTGLSIRNVRVRTWSDVPEGGEFTETGGIWTLRDGHRFVYPTPIVGFKLGF